MGRGAAQAGPFPASVASRLRAAAPAGRPWLAAAAFLFVSCSKGPDPIGPGTTTPSARDFAITDAQATQGAQAADGSVAMVLSGNGVVFNVLVKATGTSVPMQLVLRLFNSAGTLVSTDTATTGTLGPAPGYAAPSAQFLVRSPIEAGTQWQIARDPHGVVPDDSAVNDVFPRSGRASLATVSVPPLLINFVPIVLSAHGSATGQVSVGQLGEYLRTLRSVHPIGVVTPTIGTPFTTSANFGSPPSGGDQPFWQQVLAELDLARVTSGANPAMHWYGVVLPPAGFNFTQFGGFGYIPNSGDQSGSGTRTAVAVQLVWFNRPTQGRDLVAHELAHNFGRRHAPCGGAANPDPGFPDPLGTIGLPGHDVYSWFTSNASSAAVLPATTGDVMGYCFPVWSGAYTYRGILLFRQPIVLASAPTRVLIVRGETRGSRPPVIEPVFALDAPPTAPERAGAYHLEGRAADGRTLFARDFASAELDHAPGVGHFTFAIPVTPELERELDLVEVVGPGGDTRASRTAGDLILATPAATAVLRAADGMVGVTCVGGARGILVQDATTGIMLGTSRSASMRVFVAAGTALRIHCSDGLHSLAMGAVAP